MLKDIIKQIEEREKKNRENLEKRNSLRDTLNKNKLENKKKREEKAKENAIKEEKLEKERKKEKMRIEEEEKIKKQQEKEEKLNKIKSDNKRRNTLLLNFRMKNNIEEGQFSQEDMEKRISFWKDLAENEKKDLKKRFILKDKILKEEYESRNKKNTNTSTQIEIVKLEDTKKQIKTIENMCILGDILKKEIIEEKKATPENFIPIEEAVKKDEQDPNFILGLLAKKLEHSGITTAIEKENINEGKDMNESSTSLQFLVNGLSTKKKFNLHFDINEKRNEELLDNKEEQEKFINKLRKKLSKEYNIAEDKIIITNPQRGSFQLSVIFLFQNEDFKLNLNELKEKFNDEPELIKLKEVQEELLFTGCKLNSKMLDERGNNADGGWAEGEKRGGEEYIPPQGWIGYGLKVLDRYDLEKKENRNDWLSYDNREGEWCVAYHGVGFNYSSKDVKKAVRGIATYTLKEKNEINNEEDDEEDYATDEDVRHPGNKVGKGVYCSPYPEIMDNYAGIVEINNKKYKMGFMLRVNPEKIRVPTGNLKFWVLNGNDDEVRPYRILIKKVEE